MIYVKINETLYPATITGTTRDLEWGERESKSVRLEGTYERVNALFTDAVSWSIVMEELVDVTPQFVTDEEGNPVYEQIDVTPKFNTDPETGDILFDEEGHPIPYTGDPVYKDGALIPYNGDPIYENRLVEYDNSEYSIRGDLLIHTDGTCTVKMGKPTEAEAAQLAAAAKEAELANMAARNAELEQILNILLGGEIE